MSDGMTFRTLDVDAVDVVLCDADGTLFDSEVPAFAASTVVTNQLLVELGVDRTYTPSGLRRWGMGRNFRATAPALAADVDVVLDAETLERWVGIERDAVVAQLAAVLQPTPSVGAALEELAQDVRLFVVTSSATARLDACLDATGLDHLFPRDVRFSAEDSLPTPSSKPDPAIYRFALAQADVPAARCLAVEDAVAGVRSAVAAGIPTLGMLQFVPKRERRTRIVELRDAGVAAIVPSWRHVVGLLHRDHPGKAEPTTFGACAGGSRSGVPSTG
jgi:beta-phosphoglucomutase-like phosphatase (HAD superfamily)